MIDVIREWVVWLFQYWVLMLLGPEISAGISQAIGESVEAALRPALEMAAFVILCAVSFVIFVVLRRMANRPQQRTSRRRPAAERPIR